MVLMLFFKCCPLVGSISICSARNDHVRGSLTPKCKFFQSLVLVSRLPYVNLFQSLLQLIAPEYFDKLEPCLEAGEQSDRGGRVCIVKSFQGFIKKFLKDS